MLTLEDLKKMNAKELTQELNKAKLDLYKLRLGVSMRQSKESAKLKFLRRYIARINTVSNAGRMKNAKREVVTKVKAGAEA